MHTGVKVAVVSLTTVGIALGFGLLVRKAMAPPAALPSSTPPHPAVDAEMARLQAQNAEMRRLLEAPRPQLPATTSTPPPAATATPPVTAATPPAVTAAADTPKSDTPPAATTPPVLTEAEKLRAMSPAERAVACTKLTSVRDEARTAGTYDALPPDVKASIDACIVNTASGAVLLGDAGYGAPPVGGMIVGQASVFRS